MPDMGYSPLELFERAILTLRKGLLGTPRAVWAGSAVAWWLGVQASPVANQILPPLRGSRLPWGGLHIHRYGHCQQALGYRDVAGQVSRGP